MRQFILLLPLLLLFIGCSPKPKIEDPRLPQTYLLPATYDQLANWQDEKYDDLLHLFQKNCETNRARQLYNTLCSEAVDADNAKTFFEDSFTPYKIVNEEGDSTGLMTGYYEPLLYGSREQSERYRYPLYSTPDDLLTIKLDDLFPELKGKRVRGRLEGKTVMPYRSRSEMAGINATVICWVDDKVDLFFLEVQGSGRIALENGETIFVGFANHNGHPYHSIGKYLIDLGEIPREEISLQSIRKWLNNNPERIDEVLNSNPGFVFFQQREHAASGSLGIVLTPERSIAVDRRYIPMGAMLYMNASDPVTKKPIRQTVFAQDTGGAIKGEVRADYFWGYGKEAEEKAGKMKEGLELWIFLPKESSKVQLKAK